MKCKGYTCAILKDFEIGFFTFSNRQNNLLNTRFFDYYSILHFVPCFALYIHTNVHTYIHTVFTWHRTQISQFHCYGVFTFSHVLRAAPHINKLNNIYICKQQIDRPTDQPNETTTQTKESTAPNKQSKEFVLGLNSRRSLS